MLQHVEPKDAPAPVQTPATPPVPADVPVPAVAPSPAPEPPAPLPTPMEGDDGLPRPPPEGVEEPPQQPVQEKEQTQEQEKQQQPPDSEEKLTDVPVKDGIPGKYTELDSDAICTTFKIKRLFIVYIILVFLESGLGLKTIFLKVSFLTTFVLGLVSD